MGLQEDAEYSERARGCLLLLSLAALTWMYSLDPSSDTFTIPCVFHQWTGWACPGCGGQRALHALLHGHLWSAFDHNPLLVVLLFSLPAVWWFRGGNSTTASHAPSQGLLPVLGGLLALTIVFGILRNLPWPPVAWMAP